MSDIERKFTKEEMANLSDEVLQQCLDSNDVEMRQLAADELYIRLERNIQQSERANSKYQYTSTKSSYIDVDSLLTDDFIKSAMIKKACPWWPMFLIIVGVFLIGYYQLPMFIPYEYIKYLFPGCIALSLLIIIIYNAYRNHTNTKAQEFVKTGFRDAQLFQTTVVSARKRRHDHRTYYSVVIQDEKGRDKLFDIDSNTYGWFKNSVHKKVYMLKIPKYNGGYFYEFFIYDLFKNESSIVEKRIEDVV